MTDVLVVIGAGGMGETIARRQAPGRTTLLADFNESAIERLAESMRDDGFDVVTQRVDVSSRASVQAVATRAAELGDVKYLVHTAGLSPTQAPLDAILRVDLVGVALVLEAFATVIAPGGAGVIISSSSSYLQPPFSAAEQAAIRDTAPEELLTLPFFSPEALQHHAGIAYGRAKLANRIQVQGASVGSWGERRARITSVSPGVISTAMGREELASPSGAFMRAMVENSGAARLGTPSDIADAVTFLLSPQASFISGIDLLVDGGSVAGVVTGKTTLPTVGGFEVIAAGSALLVIDLQALTLPNAVTRSADELLPDVARLIAEFRTRDLPVLHAVSTGMPIGRTSYGEGGRTWPLELRAIADAVQPAPHEPVVERAAWSAFAGTEMLELLTERGVTTVVIVGLATPFGIESTARSAYDLGFSVVVPSDAVAGPDASAHEWTLTRVIPLLGTTTTVGELLAE